jgi:putative transposase
LTFRTWGGRRAGAGRKRIAPRPMTPHRRRPFHHARHPVLVTIRVADGLPSLRRRRHELAVREAMITTARREDFRIVHYSIQGNHLHQIVEAADTQALSRGMQGFQISAARHLNRQLGRTGRLFVGRYHAQPLTSPRQVRHALAYVLGNWRRHGVDGPGRVPHDRFSNGRMFDGWIGGARLVLRKDLPDVWLPTFSPKTWLLQEGWRRHGLLDPWERPGDG